MRNQRQLGWIIFCIIMQILLVTANADAQGGEQWPMGGQVFWKKEMGLVPSGPGNQQASANPCSAFFLYSTRDGKVVGYSTTPEKPYPVEKDGYYVCGYLYKIEASATRGSITKPGMGDGSRAPQMSRQSMYWTDAWIGGSNSRPPAGRKRGFIPNENSPYPSALNNFEMIYVRSDYEPNPSAGSDAGVSPLLSRSMFAGAWLVKIGDTVIFPDLVIQVSGSQISGLLSANRPELGIFKNCTLSGNILRFTIWRPRSVSNSNEVQLGTGELVMDGGGTLFRGNVMGNVVTGTLLGR